MTEMPIVVEASTFLRDEGKLDEANRPVRSLPGSTRPAPELSIRDAGQN
jgi:hypothetical protein